ncbi:hypothetical protein [Spiroplasma culicicola]|uniref:Transmembrane protein n=1 Tax=Spiroplasma culicicola AES-1 TaxID=1276246 RepID=W6A7X9_9MOLU|nr:hypothetical protein [Spiroplasma culicicola]AHI53096.1 hypothetical protein SCULI_v1c07550 [Spiroplasma culicicola AES-1]
MTAIIVVLLFAFSFSLLAIWLSTKGLTSGIVLGFLFGSPLIGAICIVLRNQFYMNIKLNKSIDIKSNLINIFTKTEEGEYLILVEDDSEE